jgi:4'-phosphopantetheinyl transferase EntD
MNNARSGSGAAIAKFAAADVRPEMPPGVETVVLDREDLPASRLHPEEVALLHPDVLPAYLEEFTLGREAARRALARLGAPPGPILRGAHGEPLWPEGFVGSISHAGGVAVAAVAAATRYGGIGLDVECATGVVAVASRIAYEHERDWLEAAPFAHRERRGLRLFSAKESVFKAFFPRIGERFWFEHARLRWTPASAAFRGRLTAPYDGVEGSQDIRIDVRDLEGGVLTWTVIPRAGGTYPAASAS